MCVRGGGWGGGGWVQQQSRESPGNVALFRSYCGRVGSACDESEPAKSIDQPSF